MNKRALLKAILATLQAEMQSYVRAAKSARAEATDPQSRAENKYDTRGLEASYLAAGQVRQVMELESAIAAFEALAVRKFTAGEGEGIGLGALVELKQNGAPMLYFIGPAAGGTEVQVGKREVLVITPQSPLGGQLQGHRAGDQFELVIGGAKRRAEVLRVE